MRGRSGGSEGARSDAENVGQRRADLPRRQQRQFQPQDRHDQGVPGVLPVRQREGRDGVSWSEAGKRLHRADRRSERPSRSLGVRQDPGEDRGPDPVAVRIRQRRVDDLLSVKAPPYLFTEVGRPVMGSKF